MKNDALIQELNSLIKPLADELDYELYHIEFVRESNDFYLRIYIDKEGGIFLSDCEALSRRVSDVLDEKDPIVEPYFLEVSSPGIFRQLFTTEHYNRYLGSQVMVKLSKAIEGKKVIKGILKEVTDEHITVETDTLVTIPKDKIKSTNLDGEL